jgi:hypothetical protein
MKIFVGSLVIFFGSLLAAGLVALGQPVAMDVVPHAAPSQAPGNAAPEPAGRADESGWERLLAIRGFH